MQETADQTEDRTVEPTDKNKKGTKTEAPKSIKKNAVYNLISKILALIVPVITTPYLARVLGEVGNGQISYVSSIITYFTLAAGLGFSVYGQREIAKYRDDKEEKSRVFWEIFITKTITTIVSLAVLAALLFTVGFGETYNLLMLIMALQVLAEIFNIEFLYMGEENFKQIAIRNIVVKIIGIVCIFIFVRTEKDVWIYALYLASVSVFSYFVMWFGIKRVICTVPFKRLRPLRHLKGALIVFLPLVVTSLFTTFDKTMIGLLSANPDYDNGCYEQAYKINSIAQTFIVVFSSVTMSRNVYDYQHGDIASMNERIYKTCRYVWMTSLFFVVGFLVLSGNFSSWFLGEGYDEVPLLLWIMSVRLLVSGFSTIFGDRFIAIGKASYWMIAVVIGALTNIGINYWLIPLYGSVGAAIATAACEVMILVAMAILTFRKNGLAISRICLPAWRYLLAAIAAFFLMFFMQKWLGMAIWTFFVIGGAGTLVYGGILLVLRDSFLSEMVKTIFKKRNHMKGTK